MIYRARVASPEFVGRREELAFLKEMFTDTRRSCGAVFVGGDAGVGKTRLLSELCEVAQQAGGRVLMGGCPPLYEANLPFAPIAEALRPLFRDPDSLGDRESLALIRTEFSKLAPGAQDRTMGSSATLGASAQSDLFEHVLRFLESVAEEMMTLLIIEDLHWADRSTLDLLTFLIRNAGSQNLFILATYRTDELPPLHPLRPLLAELVHGRRVETIELRAFSRPEAIQLLTSIRGSRPAADLADCVFQRSAGNALFIEELLGATGQTLPSTLQDLLMARVRAVSKQGREVLRIAAVSGRPIKYALLAHVAGVEEEALLDALHECIDCHLLVQTTEGDGYTFRHPLLREAVSADLLPGEKVRVHKSLANTLASHPDLAEGTAATLAAELAYHWHGARDLESALAASVLAGDAATDVYAFAEAAGQYERALEIWDLVDSAEEVAQCSRCEVMDRAAAAACLNGDPLRAVALVQAAIAMMDPGLDPIRVSLLYERLGEYLVDTGETKAALAARIEAVRFMPPHPPSADLARVISAEARSLMILFRFDESAEMCRKALLIAREVGARAIESHTLNTLGVDLLYRGKVDEGLAALAEAKEVARELGDADAIERAYNNRARVLQISGRLPAALAEFEEGIAITKELGLSSSTVSWLQYNYADVLFRLGRLDEVADLLPRVPTVVSGGAVVLGALVTANLALARGELDDAIASAQHAEVSFEEDLECASSVAAVLVEALLWKGEVDSAVALVREALPFVVGGRELFETSRFLMISMRALAESARRLRVQEGAEDPADLAREGQAVRAEMTRLIGETSEGGPAFPQVCACRASLEAEWTRLEGEPEVGAWETALSHWQALGHELDAAYACLRLAEAHASVGHRSDLVTTLRLAHGIAERVGASLLSQEIAALARRTRVPLTGPSVGAAHAGQPRRAQRHVLTAREVQVLRYLGQGMTDREIASHLTISHKTAGAHVANIRKKLRVETRLDAAAYAIELDRTTG